jgi:hypothetical protein
MRAAAAERQRTWGEPRSGNGASSFHLIWDVPQIALREVSATLEVLDIPSVRRLYFWALQASFVTGRRIQGGAHLGLQWHPRHPGSTAVNWGGYGPADRGTRELEGSTSPLPSIRKNPNTRDFTWIAGQRYRLHIGPAPDSPEALFAWRGSVTCLDSGEVTEIRDLYTRGEYLVSPMVWTESFARCEHPPVSVRWSNLVAVGADGTELRPPHIRVNYQSRSDGGCDNTTVSIDELGVLQTTATPREVPQGAILPCPSGLG